MVGGLAVHDQPAKILFVNIFILVDSLCKLVNPSFVLHGTYIGADRAAIIFTHGNCQVTKGILSNMQVIHKLL